MGHKVVVFDISVIRALWETRVKKHKAWQRKEAERLEKSALEKIKEEWNFVAECRSKGIPQAVYCKNGFIDTSVRLLEKIGRNSLTRQSSLSKERDKQSSAFVFELSGEQWKVSRCVCVCATSGSSMPGCLQVWWTKPLAL